MSGTLYTPDIGAKINQEDVAAAGAVVSWLGYDGTKDGSAVTISTATANASSLKDCVSLSATRSVIVFADSANSNFLTVALINTSGTTPVLLGSMLVVSSTSTQAVKISKIDSQFVAVMYVQLSGAKGRIIDIDGGGTDIIGLVGSEQDLSSNINLANNVTELDIDLLDSTHLIAVFKNDSSSDIEGSVITVNTGTGAMTDNTVTNLFTGTVVAHGLHVLAYDSTHFIVSATESTVLVITSGSVSSTTITKIDSDNSTEISTPSKATEPWISNDGSIISTGAVGDGVLKLSNLSIFDFDDTAGASAITSIRAMGLTTILGTMKFMETVGGDDYFIVMSRSGENTFTALSGAKFELATSFLSTSDTQINTGTTNNNGTSSTDISHTAISGTKALFIIRDTSDSDKIKVYIANQ